MASWKGWYEQFGQQHPVNFTSFKANPAPSAPIGGAGTDEVGGFEFSGTFSPDGKQVRFVKKYVTHANHSIYYQGDVQPNPPTIRGCWGFQPGNQDGKFEIAYK